MATTRVKDFLYEKKSYAIRGACFEVWKVFGGAFKESVIEQALQRAMVKRGLTVERQKRIPVYFEGERVGVYQPDFVVDDCILIELKCKPTLTVGDRRQLWHYLKGGQYRLGFLAHFGPERLQIVRVVYDRARKPS